MPTKDGPPPSLIVELEVLFEDRLVAAALNDHLSLEAIRFQFAIDATEKDLALAHGGTRQPVGVKRQYSRRTQG